MRIVLGGLACSGMTAAPRQLLAYRFPPGSGFEGQLVGALERIESGGAMRILDALFVGREPESGDLIAVSMSSQSAAGMVGRLLSFRLEGHARASMTERVLEGRAGDLARSLAEGLEPGAAVAAVLVEHAWALTLAESIARIGGTETFSEFVQSAAIDETWPEPPSPGSQG
jgi:hypothetical protein